MSSSPLFMSVAESIVTFRPMAQRGCRRASSGVLAARSLSGVLRNGPPEAVRMTFRTCRRLSPARHWKTPLCSLSTGMMRAPERAASRMSSAPPTTMDSLLARATRRPARTASRVGPNPLMPVMAETTISAPSARATSPAPSGPETIRGRRPPSRARSLAASRLSPTETSPGLYVSTWAARRRRLDPAARATTRKRPSRRSTTSRAEVPIEPVEPSRARPRCVLGNAYFQKSWRM
jgi:hypothetical protein